MKPLAIAITAIFLTTQVASAHHPYTPAAAPPAADGSTSSTAGVVGVSIFLGVILGLMIKQEMEIGPGCAKKKEDARLWRKLCNWK